MDKKANKKSKTHGQISLQDVVVKFKSSSKNISILLVYKIQPLLHSLIASLMWSFHCVDLRPAVG